MRFLKSAVKVVALLVVLLLLAFAVVFYTAFHRFEVEDKIHSTFFPLAMALHDFEDATGSPATNLNQLIPDRLPVLPQSPLVERVDYKVIGSNIWELSLHSKALGDRRNYCCRSNQKFSAEEEARVILEYHGIWVVLRE